MSKEEKGKEVKDASKLEKLQAAAFRKIVEIEQLKNRYNAALGHLSKELQDLNVAMQKEG